MLRFYSFAIGSFRSIFLIIPIVVGALYAGFHGSFPPFLPAVDEVRLQATLNDDAVADIGPATLNSALRSVEIRATLQDTLRLRGELG